MLNWKLNVIIHSLRKYREFLSIAQCCSKRVIISVNSLMQIFRFSCCRLEKRKNAPASEGTYTSAKKVDWLTDSEFSPTVTNATDNYTQGMWEGM